MYKTPINLRILCIHLTLYWTDRGAYGELYLIFLELKFLYPSIVRPRLRGKPNLFFETFLNFSIVRALLRVKYNYFFETFLNSSIVRPHLRVKFSLFLKLFYNLQRTVRRPVINYYKLYFF